MSDAVQAPQQQRVYRIGILLGDIDKMNEAALKFLVLRMNMLQSFFEFEFLPVPSDQFILKFSHQSIVERQEAKVVAPAFLERYRKYLDQEIAGFELKELPPNHFILVTLARFSDNYYSAELTDSLAILALGNWKRGMAPPSLLEFILAGILREAVALLSPPLLGSVHLGTKGCLFDFTPTLDDTKFKILNCFICNHCRDMLQTSGFGKLPEELVHVLGMSWFGKSSDPDAPAGIAAKLGYDLFLTKGPAPTLWETVQTTLQQEGVKQLLTIVGTIIGAIVIALLLVWFRLK